MTVHHMPTRHRARTGPLGPAAYTPTPGARGDIFIIRRGVRTRAPLLTQEPQSPLPALVGALAAAFAMGIAVGIILFGWLFA